MPCPDEPLTGLTAGGIAFDRAGPPGEPPVLLIHAGIADRRMWDPVWDRLVRTRDVLRIDLRGFGDSVSRPLGMLDPVADVLQALAELRMTKCHVVGASFGAGVAVELALTAPAVVSSLFLAAPGGALIPDVTEDLSQFIDAEDAALAAGDLDTAAAINVRWWVDGPGRDPDEVEHRIRAAVHQMQRRAFELTADWDDVEEHELDPPASERLAEIRVPTMVLTGEFDLQAIHEAAIAVTRGITGVRSATWRGVAHLPSMERPEAFVVLLEDFLASVGGSPSARTT